MLGKEPGEYVQFITNPIRWGGQVGLPPCGWYVLVSYVGYMALVHGNTCLSTCGGSLDHLWMCVWGVTRLHSLWVLPHI